MHNVDHAIKMLAADHLPHEERTNAQMPYL
jgi:hypothetical protein